MTDLVVHWLHLTAAILWVGSLLFTSLGVQPVLRRRLSPEARLGVYAELGKRFNILQWSCLGVLLATGLQKLWTLRHSPEAFRGPLRPDPGRQAGPGGRHGGPERPARPPVGAAHGRA